jgi:trehalose 6-phosphate synthase
MLDAPAPDELSPKHNLMVPRDKWISLVSQLIRGSLPAMRRALRFIVVLVIGLALVALLAANLVRQITTSWFEKDIALRASLVVSGARQALVDNWRPNDPKVVGELLADITHDERIMATAACTLDSRLVAATADFPSVFGCAAVGRHMQGHNGRWTSWDAVSELPGGMVHVSAIPVETADGPLGFVVLIHDMSYIDRRVTESRVFTLGVFGFLALAASAVTVIAARLSWRSWTNDLRSILRGGSPRPEFRPLIRDVRELIDRLASEDEAEQERDRWTPARLKQTLNRYLHGEKVMILANREPYIHNHTNDSSIEVLHPASGLVTALEPVMRACSGTWIAHGSGTADRETVDAHGRVRVPPGEESYAIRRVWLSAEEERGYYYGFSNEGLWPLCHIAHTRPIFRAEDWAHYQAVNQRFADAVCAEADADDPIVLVQDYHFALAPRLIRERLPRATIIMFWHIPWPNAQGFGICPWRRELLEGMLGASIVGFHTQLDCNHFNDAVDQLLEARIDREQHAIVQHGRRTLVRPYPISIEWPSRWLAMSAPVAECRRRVFEELGLRDDALLGVGVDRLDYTKGIEERLLAVERLLERYPAYRGRFTFVQLAAPSRAIIERYRQLSGAVEAIAERVNAKFGTATYQPIVLLRAHHEPPTVFRYYRAADVCYVSSLHDGMNLVAKEFVSARDDERGVLVLSQFTGAARDLPEALVVNPYDLEEASAALASAVTMSAAEQGERMRAMRSFVSEFNVYRWAGRMLVDAARVRRRERVTGRLSGHAELRSEIGAA